jgi:Lysophospholipase
MPHDAFWLPASEHCRLYVHQWLPATPVKAVVLLAHGMAEHAGRYQRLGQALCMPATPCWQPDLRGHGRTAEQGSLGLFARQHGWNAVVNDLGLLAQHIGQQFPAHRCSCSATAWAATSPRPTSVHHSASLHGAILSGSNFQPATLYRAARLIARLEAWRQGPLGKSALIEWLSFGSFNNAFKPTRTAFDWLSRDPAEVDKYVNDPLCGFRCSNQLWLDLLTGAGADQPRRGTSRRSTRTCPCW